MRPLYLSRAAARAWASLRIAGYGKSQVLLFTAVLAHKFGQQASIERQLNFWIWVWRKSDIMVCVPSFYLGVSIFFFRLFLAPFSNFLEWASFRSDVIVEWGRNLEAIFLSFIFLTVFLAVWDVSMFCSENIRWVIWMDWRLGADVHMVLLRWVLQPQGDHIDLARKRHGYRPDYFERKRKKDAREVHKRAAFAQKVCSSHHLLVVRLSFSWLEYWCKSLWYSILDIVFWRAKPRVNPQNHSSERNFPTSLY